MRRPAIGTIIVTVWIAAAAACAPRQEPVTRGIDPPAADGAMAPRLTADGEGLLLTWIEPAGGGGGAEALAVRISRLQNGRWTQPATIVRDVPLFANWADVPAVVRGGDGALLAHWLEKSGEGTYAYDVQLARSGEGASGWRRLGPAHDDGTRTEHGFVSMTREAEGARLFWLDGRQMKEGEAGHGGDHGSGAMTLRTALAGVAVGSGEMLDERVCECCPTGAAITSRGPVVVYRDRSPDEVRDIHIVRREGEGWTAPRPVHVDGWEVPGCPVNGPAVASDGDRLLVVAWFTAPANEPRVLAAFSRDGGASFARPVTVDTGQPFGRAGVALTPEGEAIVSWLADGGPETAAVRLRRVAPDGSAGPPMTVATTGSGRGSGVPRIARVGEDLAVVWTQTGTNTRLRGSLVPLALVPPARAAGGGGPAAGRGGAPRPWDRQVGSAAPGYAADSLDGARVALEELRGSAVLVNLWATWCLPCREEIPVLAALHRAHQASGLRVVGVSVDEAGARGRVREVAGHLGIPYLVLHDPDDRASALFGVTMLPASFLFDRDGVLVWSRQGVVAPGDAELAAAIRAALE